MERKIVIGLITSTDFLNQIKSEWRQDYIVSDSAKMIALWCWEYYDKYEEAPGKAIDLIYTKKIAKKGNKITKDVAEEIEFILNGLSEQYVEEGDINVPVLLQETRDYFVERSIALHNENVQSLLQKGEVNEALKLIENFKVPKKDEQNLITLGSRESIQALKEGFEESEDPIVTFSGALGELFMTSFRKGDLIGILAPEKRGKCLPGNQKVLLPNGKLLEVEEIVKRKKKWVVSFNEDTQRFEKAKIIEHWENGVKPVYKVKTRTGREVQVTYNHPFLTPEGWKDLDKISIGDFIAIPKKLNFFGTLKLEENQIKLLAYFITEGCLREYKSVKGTIKIINFTNAEKNIQDDFTECVEKMKCEVVWNGINGRVKNGVDKKNYILRFLKSHKLWNKLSYQKSIPKIIYQIDKKGVALFLRILFTCDGWVSKTDGQIGYATTNKELAFQIQELLTRFGIISKVTFGKNKHLGAWNVLIRDLENCLLFSKEIGFLFSKNEKMKNIMEKRLHVSKSFFDKFPPIIAKKFYDELQKEGSFYKSSILEEIKKNHSIMRQSFDFVKNTKTGQKFLNSEIFWDSIISVEYVGDLPTYDLTVENNHNFVAENILVHNTFMLLEIMMQSYRQKRKVLFIQAGDMNESDQMMRVGIFLSKRSNEEQFCEEMYLPVRDCKLNQMDSCMKKERESRNTYVFNEEQLKEGVSYADLIEAYENNPDYEPCRNCAAWHNSTAKLGAVWLKKHPKKDPLTFEQARRKVKNFFSQPNAKLATYENGTCSINVIRNLLKQLKREENWEPDIILVDYADILVSSSHKDERHNIDEIWKGLRRISQSNNKPVVVAPTQANRDSYTKKTIKKGNASEDKRKIGHVTAMYGLNQDPDGREKEIGILRINTIVARKSKFTEEQQVTVLQRLEIGRPYLGSFW